jgi:hypothetical protein
LGSAVFVGDEGEAVEVGVEGAQSVDLGAVAGGGGRPPVRLLEAVAPLFEVAVDLLGRDRAGRPPLEPGGVAADCVAVFAAGAGAARLPGEVGVERLEQTLVVAFRARPPRGWSDLSLDQDRPPFLLRRSPAVLLVVASMQARLHAKIQSQKALHKPIF